MQFTKEKVISYWKNDRIEYQQLTELLDSILKDNAHKRGLNVRVLSRRKEDDSLMKKLYKKGFDYYPSMTDKAAARVICKFKQDVLVVQDLISELFEVINEENKIHQLDFSEQGYKSIHFDVKLKETFVKPDVYKLLKNHIAEIQVRTNCEDTWAEIYHDIGYKAGSDIGAELKREFYCLAGLLEVADNCFSSLQEKIMQLDVLNEVFILNYLKEPFIRKIKQHYDVDFSYENISILLPLLDSVNIFTTNDFTEQMNIFISNKSQKIDFILNQNRDSSNEIPYLTQPEIFLIFFFIENNKYDLIETWEKYFPHEDLDKLFTYWGDSLEDYDIH